jgi:hypothetical protein
MKNHNVISATLKAISLANVFRKSGGNIRIIGAGAFTKQHIPTYLKDVVVIEDNLFEDIQVDKNDVLVMVRVLEHIDLWTLIDNMTCPIIHITPNMGDTIRYITENTERVDYITSRAMLEIFNIGENDLDSHKWLVTDKVLDYYFDHKVFDEKLILDGWSHFFGVIFKPRRGKSNVVDFKALRDNTYSMQYLQDTNVYRLSHFIETRPIHKALEDLWYMYDIMLRENSTTLEISYIDMDMIVERAPVVFDPDCLFINKYYTYTNPDIVKSIVELEGYFERICDTRDVNKPWLRHATFMVRGV